MILTTHHLEEAEQLAKRIGIMSKGQLVIVGSREFITDKFSVGYHVIINLDPQNPQAELCRQIIRE